MPFDLDLIDKDSTTYEKFIEVAIAGLGLIGSLVGGGYASKGAGTLAAIKVIVDLIQGVYDGEITTDRVEREFAKVRQTIEQHNAAADAALKKKFGKDDE